MTTVNILIDSVEKVKKFSSILSKEGPECDLVQGVHILDAKSIMGIFSLDITKPIQLDIHADNPEMLDAIREFIV